MHRSLKLFLLCAVGANATHAQTVNLLGNIITVRGEERTMYSGEVGSPPRWQKLNGAMTIGPIVQSGQFVQLNYNSTALVRLPDGRGGGDASGGSCLLVFADGRWYLLSAAFWVT